MKRWIALAASATILVSTAVQAQRPTLGQNVRKYLSSDSALTVITGVTVIDGKGTAAVPGQTVVLRDGHIAEVGPAVKVKMPAGALVVDGSGMTLIPGIVGLHDHMYYSAAGGVNTQMSYTGPRLYLASGVTSVRTTGSISPYGDINLKRSIEAGETPGPRMHITTPYLTGGAGGGEMFATDEPAAAKAFVTYWAREGATWVKFYADISRAAMKAAIDEAHRLGIKTTGHLCSVTFREAVELGIDDLSHGAFTATDFVPDKEPDKCPPNSYKLLDSLATGEGPVATSLIDLMVQRKVSMTTTMAVVEAFYPGRPVTDARTLDLMTPAVRAAYTAQRAYIDTTKGWLFTPDGFARALSFDKAFFAAGGILGSGVDPTGNGGALPGFGDQRGYELLREAGLTAEQGAGRDLEWCSRARSG